jgi:uncharacterized protein
MIMDAADYIRHLALQPHPEGGYYRETYRSTGSIPVDALPPFFNSQRPYSTAIFFLLEAEDYSAFHRIKSDECWHFYAGGPLVVHIIGSEGHRYITLGPDISKGELLQFVVPANTWFASEPAPGTEFSLVGCTVAPGFDFADFEMAEAGKLASSFPASKEIIHRLCR